MADYSSISQWASNRVTGTGPLALALYDDYLVPGHSLRGGAISPNFTIFRNGIYAYNFDGTGVLVEEAHFVIHILHDFRVGTTPTLHIHWGHNIDSGVYTAGTQNVKWQVEYTVSRGYGVSSFASTVTLSTVQTASIQYRHHITNDDDMPLTAFASELEPDSLILGRVFRDPADVADTFIHPAFLFQIDCHYQKGQTCTVERNRPFTSAGFGA